jgi:hypothetical protein
VWATSNLPALQDPGRYEHRGGIRDAVTWYAGMAAIARIARLCCQFGSI